MSDTEKLKIFFDILLKRYNNMTIKDVLNEDGNISSTKLQPIIDNWINCKIQLNEDKERAEVFEEYKKRVPKENKSIQERQFKWTWLNYGPNLIYN